MPFKFNPEIAIADVAFEVRAKTLSALFQDSAKALTEVMVDRRSVRPIVEKTVRLTSEDADTLLYDFLTQLIILKDVDSLIFKEFKAEVEGERSMVCRMRGEEIDRARHRLRNDVKAVTMHMFGIKKRKDVFYATVVLDI